MTDQAPSPRDAILDAALRIAPFEGWTERTLRQAVAKTDLPDGADALYYPGGPLDLLRRWNHRTVEHVEAELAQRGLDNMGITARVREGLLIALSQMDGHEAAMRRALSRLALPDAAGLAPQQAWAIADAIWHGIGDRSTDYNYYTKRTILAGIISASTLAWLNDNSPDKAEARAFIDRRLDGVIAFEKAKAKLRRVRDQLPNPAELAGRLRFGELGMPSGPGPFRASTKRRRRRSR